MSEETDRHLDRDNLEDVKTKRYFKNRINILDTETVKAPFVGTNQISSNIIIPNANAHNPDTDNHLDDNEFSLLDFFNGTFIDKITGALTQSGTDVRLTVGKQGGGDLRAFFSSGVVTIADNSTIDLPQGSDTVPIKYFVYVLESTGVLTSSTVNFPSAEHAKVGTVLAPLAAFVAAKGAYHFQIHNDPAMDENNQGHNSHHTFRTRVQGAKYLSGIDGAGTSDYLTIAANNVEFKSSVGVVSQMHPHAYGAKDTSTGTIMLMANDATTPYNDFTDLFSIVTLKDGVTAWDANKWIKLVFFGSANQSGTFSPIFCNKPSGQENTASLARQDFNNYADFDIPAEFLGTGFRICSVVVQKKETWGFDSTQDLREGLGAGGGGGGHVKYTDAEVEAYVNSVANAGIATGDSLVFTDVTDGVLKQDLVSDLLVLALAAVEAANPFAPENNINAEGSANTFYNISTGQTNKFGRDATQYLAIGVNDADATISLVQDENTAHALILQNTMNGSGACDVKIQTAGANDRLIVDKAGLVQIVNKLGIAMTPTTDLELLNDSAQKPTTNTWTITPSGRDFKQNIEDYTQGLATLMNIRPRQFKYKPVYDQEKTHDMEKTHVGIVAEEMELVMPSTIGMGKRNYNHRMIDTGKVDENEEPILKEEFDTVDTYTYNSHEVMYVMINAIKELKLENDDLRTRLSVIEGGK